ncbi:hypothetical protein CJ179_47965 [Rhodococcus sp. ACS1]|uniref:nuclear transport factor 2 family protein n=1 Tax=Rhodococcus sp. ACS1 TaxID=2028570 RepID=UPI000BB1364E|nr:nuclear transport factor 2 family protein [Rhodococcus sp. ACS1]PBC35348.1 hypothetical protein CJ179_47965 [Rhodococcus sp. ACS1]
MSDARFATVEQWVCEHQDRETIRALAAAYQRGCDGGWDGPSHADPDHLASLFCHDATYKIPQRSQPARGRDEIRDVFADLQASLPHVIHYLTNDSITLNGDRAHGEFKGIAAIWSEGRRHLAFGFYTGQFLRVEGQWRFQSWQFELVHPPRRPRVAEESS